jgi:AraC-like DNA-binding protein
LQIIRTLTFNDIVVMPIYMDIHEVPGAEPEDLAEAHRKDMLIQSEYRCNCMTYWMDEKRGNAFCLIEAPDRSAMEAMHKKSHGFMPSKIIEVNNEIVESFLGRTTDPEQGNTSKNGLKVFSDSAFRVLLVSEIEDPVLLKHQLGQKKAGETIERINSIIREQATLAGGREAEIAGNGFIFSFSSAIQAVDGAMAIQKNLSPSLRKSAGFKLAIHAGDPVAKSDRVFGDTIQLASHLNTLISAERKIVISSAVKEILPADYLGKKRSDFFSLSSQEETVLDTILCNLNKHCQDADFTITRFCKIVSMSKSQLYRKTISLWNLSPVQLLKEFRLDKARKLLKKQQNNISQTTFDAGFSSPSYFTKCFKKKYGLIPAGYVSLLK